MYWEAMEGVTVHDALEAASAAGAAAGAGAGAGAGVAAVWAEAVSAPNKRTAVRITGLFFLFIGLGCSSLHGAGRHEKLRPRAAHLDKSPALAN